MKARHRRILFFSVISVFFALILMLAIVPPMFSLDRLRPGLENAILRQTEIPAKIHGRINISLLGRASIVAYDVRFPNGKIDSVMFAVPLSKIFNISDADLTGRIYVDGANARLESLYAPGFNAEISITDSVVHFLGQDYKIINGTLSDGNFSGSVRTNQHKYVVEKNGAEFSVVNKNEGLHITGEFLHGGGANATLTIDTNDINAWFDFFEPDIYEHVNLAMNINWDGKYGFVFSNLHGEVGGDPFTGQIELPEVGIRKIKFASDKIDFDLSFLITQQSLLKNSEIDLDLRGRLKFANTYYNKAKLVARGAADSIIIENLEFENDRVKGAMRGEITSAGAKDLALRFSYQDAEIYCLFNGMPEIWRCDEYEYVDANLAITGTLTYDAAGFAATMKSNENMPDNFDFAAAGGFLGDNGTIIFEFANAAGKIEIKNKKQTIIYDFITNKNLNWIPSAGFDFLPDLMRREPGDMKWTGKDFSFIPQSGKWELTTQGNFFYLSAASGMEFLRAFYPSLEMPFVNDFPLEISGNFSGANLSDIELRIAGHIFRGSANGKGVTLKTNTLNLDAFANKNYLENYEEMQFLSAAPMLTPFELSGAKFSIAANNVIWNGTQYDNFVYSLRDRAQDLGITDDALGSLLVSIKKSAASEYDVRVKLNRFAFVGKLLDDDAPLNISDSVLTGQALLQTSGKIAYDFWRNMKGAIELAFDGGVLNGIGTDAFYAGAATITQLNAEDRIAYALSGGNTMIKSLNIIGEYGDGKFQTTQNFRLTARNMEMSGNMQLADGIMTAQTQVLLRGTAPQPRPVSLNILPSGERNYSLSEIMSVLDVGYLAAQSNSQ
jgi:hypothetical protein